MDSESPQGVVMGRAEIEAWIPHRAPFLFVDRVLEVTDERILSEWEIDPAADFLRGHYPGNPIVPGVLLNEFVFQSAAILMARLDDLRPGSPEVPVLTRIQGARFKRVVRPGEVVRAETTLGERLGPACYMNAKLRTEKGAVGRLEFVVALTRPEGGR